MSYLKKIITPQIYCLLIALSVSINVFAQAESAHYLDSIKVQLRKEWPKNRTINLVFHGHSVPSGYFKTPLVNTLQAYPFLAFKLIKEKYPYAVINVIITAIGGENSVSGQKRFKRDVLTHKPDVLFIDYALNDKVIGIKKSTKAMSKMIEAALKKNIKVILLTPSPHQSFNILDNHNPYEAYTNELIALAKKYNVGLVDSYHLFKQRVEAGHDVKEYMSQINHPNEAGHQIIADAIAQWF
ncbi:SGNH/GDSL hydrolase family protein [Mucilaginibacter boryungensis]|uniref:SGNH/GDSL hydrolase family protein n=1 Tax=Mucilaginibacter boryungensis TaxID=768480 RepID=A0ABR9XDD3_9SPHI|nr:GDSL-type esterase/lipase family protein [Mucilaginibacter boryungensis]MBE9665403.1 SGNH/GDSL hydrolase family protein [Mucilaginibacter boryungensis]